MLKVLFLAAVGVFLLAIASSSFAFRSFSRLYSIRNSESANARTMNDATVTRMFHTESTNSG